MRNIPIEVPKAILEAFCDKWDVAELSLFGSILTDSFTPESDVDVMVTFVPGREATFDSWFAMIAELQTIFGRPVDLVERRQVEASRNWIRRRHILNHAETVYAKR